MGSKSVQFSLDLAAHKIDNNLFNESGADWGESHYWIWQGLRSHWRVLGGLGLKPLVLIHGFGASSAHWRNNAAYFVNAGFRVYGLDLIGFGESDQPGPSSRRNIDNLFWANQLAAFLEEVVNTRRYGRAVILGNSLGSLVALTTVVSRPELVAALVAAPLPDPALMQAKGMPEIRWMHQARSLFVKIFFHLLPLELIVPLIARSRLIKAGLQLSYHRFIGLDKELLQIVCRPALRSTAARSLRAMCIGMSLRPKSITAPLLLEQLAKIDDRLPMLLLWGRQDNLVPLMIGERIAEKNSWLSFSVIENTGHCPHDECPDEFNKFVLTWLDFNLGGSK